MIYCCSNILSWPLLATVLSQVLHISCHSHLENQSCCHHHWSQQLPQHLQYCLHLLLPFVFTTTLTPTPVTLTSTVPASPIVSVPHSTCFTPTNSPVACLQPETLQKVSHVFKSGQSRLACC